MIEPSILGRMSTHLAPVFHVHQGYRVLTHSHMDFRKI